MSIAFDFTDRTVVVTGAAQGIGRAIAELFFAAGARVAPFDLDPDALEAAWGERSDSVAPEAVDVADEEAVAAAIANVTEWADGPSSPTASRS